MQTKRKREKKGREKGKEKGKKKFGSEYLPLDISCSSKLTIFLELRSRAYFRAKINFSILDILANFNLLRTKNSCLLDL